MSGWLVGGSVRPSMSFFFLPAATHSTCTLLGTHITWLFSKLSKNIGPMSYEQTIVEKQELEEIRKDEADVKGKIMFLFGFVQVLVADGWMVGWDIGFN